MLRGARCDRTCSDHPKQYASACFQHDGLTACTLSQQSCDYVHAPNTVFNARCKCGSFSSRKCDYSDYTAAHDRTLEEADDGITAPDGDT
jgi:hypothetical protein